MKMHLLTTHIPSAIFAVHHVNICIKPANSPHQHITCLSRRDCHNTFVGTRVCHTVKKQSTMSGLTHSQELALALAPKVTGTFGAWSSAFIIYEILFKTPAKKQHPILRALLGMSFFYMCDAVAWFLSTWMAPAGLTDFALASGNVSTCAFQGFWLQAVIAGPLYNTLMAYYFFLISCQGAGTKELVHLERFMQAAVLLFALGTAVVFLVDEQYSHIGAVCWVNGSPPGCGRSVFQENPEVPCERGDYAWLYGMILFYAPIWVCILLLVYFNARIYFSADVSQGDAHWVAQQAMWYFLAFVASWAPSTIWSAKHYNSGGRFGLDFAAAICEPLAGFWNLLIFLSNRPATRKRLLATLMCQWNVGEEDSSGESKEGKSTEVQEAARDDY
eukprot:scaffold5771_cov171-Amphora_coffeaeformis.AAC.34